MLQTLSIKQFAIIDELDINFSDGLTVMSGGELAQENLSLLMPLDS